MGGSRGASSAANPSPASDLAPPTASPVDGKFTSAGQKSVNGTGSATPPSPKRTPRSGSAGSATTASDEAGTTQTSPPSDEPSGDSTPPWRRPRNAKALAAQVNRVMTMVLNGQIDPDAARLYSGLGRTLAQVLSAEVYQARFMSRAADLSLDDDEGGTA